MLRTQFIDCRWFLVALLYDDCDVIVEDSFYDNYGVVVDDYALVAPTREY